MRIGMTPDAWATRILRAYRPRPCPPRFTPLSRHASTDFQTCERWFKLQQLSDASSPLNYWKLWGSFRTEH